MLVIDESAANRLDSQGYFDGSLELLRELAVTSDVDAALPRLSAIVGKMLPHDALHIACFDRRGRPLVNASTAVLPDMMATEIEDVIIDDLQTGAVDACRTARGAADRRRLSLVPGSVDPRAGADGARGVLVEVADGVRSQPRAAGAPNRVPPRPRSVPRRAGQGDSSHRRRPRAAGRRWRAAWGRAPEAVPTCGSSASPPNGARCCTRRRRSPRRTPPC